MAPIQKWNFLTLATTYDLKYQFKPGKTLDIFETLYPLDKKKAHDIYHTNDVLHINYRWAQSSVNLFRNGGTLGLGSLAGGAECAPLWSGTCWGPLCQVARHRDTHEPCAASNNDL